MKTRKINISKIVGKGYATFWNYKGRYRVVKGSRGSKKSYTVALNYIYNIMKYSGSNLLVIRKVADTNRDSTFAQLKTAIYRLGVEELWQCKTSPLEMIYKPTGQKILFRGMDDPLKITSITVEIGYLCWVWFEEAYQITNEADFNKIDMSIRGKMPKYLWKQLTVTFNPWSDRHWLNKRFFINKNKNRSNLISKGLDIHSKTDLELVMTTNFRMNEFLDDADLKIYKKMEKDNPRRFEIEGNGEWGVAEGLIFENWHEKEFDWRKLLDENHKLKAAFGLDFGYSNDPTAFICSIVDLGNKIIYVFDEHYEKRMSNKKIAKMIKDKGFSKEKVIADSAEPKSIDELKSEGLHRVRAAQKGKDSILAGIQFIQGFTVMVHPKCVNTIMELSLYCWRENKNGEKINEPIDEYNHLMDAWRYSLEEFRAERKVLGIKNVRGLF